MRPFETLHSTRTPDGTVLSLHRRDGDYFIHLDGEELMSTRRTGSESALAALACQEVLERKNPRILIGGLGFGYTLRAALEILPSRAEVVVAEIYPSVVEWNRERLELSAPTSARRQAGADLQRQRVGPARRDTSVRRHPARRGQRALGMVPELQRPTLRSRGPAERFEPH